MRINQYVARATGLSRRGSDTAIAEHRVSLNGATAQLGAVVGKNDVVQLDDNPLQLQPATTIILNKPVGYVCSRRQQGSAPTIYDLLDPQQHALKPVGRLDRDSSGLLIMTNDGQLAQTIQHPSSGKWKRYAVELDRALQAGDREKLQRGVNLDDGLSRMKVSSRQNLVEVRIQEGRNRQIRRTFKALGYVVLKLHRTAIGNLELGPLQSGRVRALKTGELL